MNACLPKRSSTRRLKSSLHNLPCPEKASDVLHHIRQSSPTMMESQKPSQPVSGMKQTYVTDIAHYLDETGELADMPGPARKLASFLVLLIDATSQVCPVEDHDTRIRCRTDACSGSIRTSLSSLDQEISWHCPDCGHNGVIRRWQGTKWNQAER